MVVSVSQSFVIEKKANNKIIKVKPGLKHKILTGKEDLEHELTNFVEFDAPIQTTHVISDSLLPPPPISSPTTSRYIYLKCLI